MAKPGDYTGSIRDLLAEQHQSELAARADEISLAHSASAQADRDNIQDLSRPQPKPVVVDEVVETVEDAEERTVVIRVADDLDDVTVGHEVFSFQKGKKYRVTENVAFVLRDSGHIYDRA